MSQPNVITYQVNLQVAHDLQRAGIPVFPFRLVKRKGKIEKVPCITDWPNRATTDTATAEAWWAKWPDAMPGIPTGPRSGFAVVDLDRKNGKDGFAEIRALGYDPDAMSPVMVESPGGSRHLYFRHEEGLRSTTDRIAPGIDTRAAGGYVAAPGAVSAKGTYRLLSGSLTDDLPPWPEALMRPSGRTREAGQGEPTGLPFHVIRAALMAVPNDARPYGEYIDFGMAIHAESDGSEEGLQAWQDWCAKNPNNDPGLNESKWEGFKADGGLTGWKIIHEAERHGWRDATVTHLLWLADFDFAFTKEELHDIEIAGLVGEPEAAEEQAAKSGGLTFQTPAECATLPARRYVIKGLLAEGDVAAIIGAPGAGKSLLAPRLGYAVAQGAEVFGRRTKAGGVLYVAAEDGHGMRARLSALRADHGEADAFQLVGGVSDLLSDKGQLKALQAEVKSRRPALIFIDTLAVAFPGLEENSAEGMGRVVAAARSLARWGAAVVLIHHDTKAGDGLPRGHSLLNGALDVALYLKREGNVVAFKPSKNRNGTTEQDFAFTIATRRLGTDEDGDAITTAICQEADTTDLPRKADKLPPAASAVYVHLRQLSPDGEPVAEASWRDACVNGRNVSQSEKWESRRDTFKRAVRDLLHRDLVQFGDGFFSLKDSPCAPTGSDTDDFPEAGEDQ